jgi:tetratricopeptide (TPR) repeat protein
MHFGLQQISVLILAPLLLLSVKTADAQAITVLSDKSSVRRCYFAALVAAQSNSAGFEDIQNCTAALQYQYLRKRDRVATHVNRGILQAANQGYEDALDDFNIAIKMDDERSEAFISRGNLLFTARYFQKAIADYSRALELESRFHKIAYTNRGMAYENIEQLDKAEADYRQAILLDPEFEIPQQKLQKLQDKLKNPDQQRSDKKPGIK